MLLRGTGKRDTAPEREIAAQTAQQVIAAKAAERPLAAETVERENAGPQGVGREAAGADRGRRCAPNHSGLSRILASLLTGGLLLAVALFLVGAALAVLGDKGEALHGSLITALPDLLARGQPAGFLGLGLFVLLAVPALRVVVSLFVFARRGEWLFAALNLVVFALLVAGVAVGLGT